MDCVLTGNCLRRREDVSKWRGNSRLRCNDVKLFYVPTFDVASVRLLSVVLFPEEGLPTRPIRGSRGISFEC